MGKDSADLLEKMIWHDDDHLQVEDTNFLLTLDWETADVTNSTLDQFVLVKNCRLVKTMLEHMPSPIENMVEFGIFKGGSIALYEALLSPKRLVGVDIKTERVKALDELLERRSATDRVRLYYGNDQADRKGLNAIVLENFKDEPVDLVVDDGSHRYEPTKASLNVFLPLLRPGGVYLIEDWAWAHWAGEEFQERSRVRYGQYADQRFPLTKLIFEAVMLSASHPGIISDVIIDPSRAFLTRGPEEIRNENFDISKTYLTSKWKMEFSTLSWHSVAQWGRWVPISVRNRVPPSLAAFARKHLAR